MGNVSLKHISKSFTPGVPVLDDLNLEIASGELFFLLGPSGCGKSTLLRILSGLTAPDSGSISFDGVEIQDLPPEKRQAAMVFQNYALWPHMTVFENVAFGLKIRKIAKKELEEKVMAALEIVHLEDYAKRKVPQLSGGQQQRVALARALAVEPPLLLLDEPLSNLDARLRDAMRDEISSICAERGFTALYVTHDRQEALSMADRMGVMKDGKIRQLGTPRELYEHPCDHFCAEFLGDVNFIKGRVSDGVFTTGFGTFPVAGKGNGETTAFIRPERISFADGCDSDTFEAELVRGSYLGDCCSWVCRAGDCELIVREFAPEERAAGDKVHLRFAPGRLLLPREDGGL